jgi:hypothetical protein
MDEAFGTEFSEVRLHTGDEAQAMNRELGARAFTHGRDIYFNRGEFRPETPEGKRLLAHELAHVVQQRGGHEQIQRQTVPDPGFRQRGDTCDPASMLTALIVWDREGADPANPSANLVGLCDAALIYIEGHRAAFERLWATATTPGPAAVTARLAGLATIRDTLRTSAATEAQYQEIASILSYFGSNVEIVFSRLGVSRVAAESPRDSLADIFGDPLLTGLSNGQIAQVHWFVSMTIVNTSGQTSPGMGLHAFLIGRGQTGTWFLSNQGDNPALHLEAPTLPALRAALDRAEAAGQTRILTAPHIRRPLLYWTGIKLLPRQDFEQPRRALAPPGTFLAEVDADVFTTGERLFAWDYVGFAYSMADAVALFPGSGLGHSFLIGERPSNVFNVYKTSPVVDTANMGVSAIDVSDSAGGLLVASPPVFAHAWLALRTATTSAASARRFRVY